MADTNRDSQRRNPPDSEPNINREPESMETDRGGDQKWRDQGDGSMSGSTGADRQTGGQQSGTQKSGGRQSGGRQSGTRSGGRQSGGRQSGKQTPGGHPGVGHSGNDQGNREPERDRE